MGIIDALLRHFVSRFPYRLSEAKVVVCFKINTQTILAPIREKFVEQALRSVHYLRSGAFVKFYIYLKIAVAFPTPCHVCVIKFEPWLHFYYTVELVKINDRALAKYLGGRWPHPKGDERFRIGATGGFGNSYAELVSHAD